MKISALKLQIYHQPQAARNTVKLTTNTSQIFIPFKQPLHVPHPRVTTIISRQILGYCHRPKTSATVMAEKPTILQLSPESEETLKRSELNEISSSSRYSRFVVAGAVSISLALLLMGADVEKAAALGPGGPLMEEEFWDNVRRYAIYALTVSTGALYTIFQPIFELLKNPISAVLILVIMGGSIYIVSQIVSAMVGVTDFTYSYGY